MHFDEMLEFEPERACMFQKKTANSGNSESKQWNGLRVVQ